MTKLGITGGVTQPEPEQSGYVKEALAIGAATRTLNGTLRSHYAAAKAAWTVPWRGLSTTQKNTLATEVVRTQDLVWLPPEGGSFNVRVMNASWHQMASHLWAADVRLEEV